jgi:hypothetical protein
VDQGLFNDPDFISGTHKWENVQFVDEAFQELMGEAFLATLIVLTALGVDQ